MYVISTSVWSPLFPTPRDKSGLTLHEVGPLLSRLHNQRSLLAAGVIQLALPIVIEESIVRVTLLVY